MTSPSDLDPNSVKISTQTLGETIHQFVDLPGLPSIQERIIHTQDDQVKKALADLGWICPQEAKAMRGDLSAKDAEIDKLKQAPAVVVPELTGPEIYRLLVKAHNGDESLPDVLEEFHNLLAGVINAWLRDHARTILADRVLGEGMVAVSREDLEILKRCFVILHRWGDYWLWANEENRQHWQNEKNEVIKMVYDRQIGSEALTQDAKHRNALRANQGGAAT